MTNIAVVGNCYFDEIYSVNSYPEPDQKVLASDLLIMLGGSATNTAVGLAMLEINPYLFTVMGDDEDAFQLFKQIRKRKINPQYINHIEGKSGRTIILLDKEKNSTKIGYQGVCSDMSKTILFDALANPKFSHVHLASVGLDSVENALKYKKNQTFSIDFGAKTLQADNERILQALNRMDLVFLNRDIFQRLFDLTIDELDQVDVSYDLVITAGTDGIYGNFSGKIHHQEIIPTEVIDTTGAGDAVAAAIIYGYKQGKNLQELLYMGTKAASHKIHHFGASNGHISKEELEKDEKISS